MPKEATRPNISRRRKKHVHRVPDSFNASIRQQPRMTTASMASLPHFIQTQAPKYQPRTYTQAQEDDQAFPIDNFPLDQSRGENQGYTLCPFAIPKQPQPSFTIPEPVFTTPFTLPRGFGRQISVPSFNSGDEFPTSIRPLAAANSHGVQNEIPPEEEGKTAVCYPIRAHSKDINVGSRQYPSSERWVHPPISYTGDFHLRYAPKSTWQAQISGQLSIRPIVSADPEIPRSWRDDAASQVENQLCDKEYGSRSIQPTLSEQIDNSFVEKSLLQMSVCESVNSPKEYPTTQIYPAISFSNQVSSYTTQTTITTTSEYTISQNKMFAKPSMNPDILAEASHITNNPSSILTPVSETWSFASTSLVSSPKFPALARLEDILSEDIPIRAILLGWSAIGTYSDLPPFWQIIRRLDEGLFFQFEPVTRLGVWKIVHLLMQWHSDPSEERRRGTPSFFNLRSTDFGPEYYVGNFLPWPGIRALLQNPLSPIRSNKFFQAETKTLRLLFPGSINDVYFRDTESGLLRFRSDFDERAKNLGCWGFEPDIFAEYPVMWGLAPCFGRVGTGIDDGREGRERERERKWLLRDNGGYVDERKSLICDGEEGKVALEKMMRENGIDYSGLKWTTEMRGGKMRPVFTLW